MWPENVPCLHLFIVPVFLCLHQSPSFPVPKSPRPLLTGTRTQRIVLLILAFGLLLLVINIYELRLMQADHAAMHGLAPGGAVVEGDTGRPDRQPIVWISGKRVRVTENIMTFVCGNI